MDDLNAITLLYLLKAGDKHASLLDCAHQFRQTKAELKDALRDEQSEKLGQAIDSGSYSM